MEVLIRLGGAGAVLLLFVVLGDLFCLFCFGALLCLFCFVFVMVRDISCIAHGWLCVGVGLEGDLVEMEE